MDIAVVKTIGVKVEDALHGIAAGFSYEGLIFFEAVELDAVAFPDVWVVSAIQLKGVFRVFRDKLDPVALDGPTPMNERGVRNDVEMMVSVHKKYGRAG